MKNKNQLFDLIYKIAFITFTFIMALLFIIFTITIYTKGKAQIEIDPTYQIYTKEIVSKYLSLLIAPFILWVLTIIFGLVTSHLYPINSKKKQELDPILTYERLSKRINLDKEVMNENYDIILNYRKFRKIGFVIISILSLICMIFPCIYIFNSSNFLGVDSNKDVLNMSLYILPFIVVMFASFIGYSFYYYSSIKKEIKILLGYSKNMPKVVVKEKFSDSPLFINIVRGVILVTGITFVVLGILNKGFEDVLIKAINICSECIGLA